MYIIHVGFGVRSFPPSGALQDDINFAKKNKQKRNKKEGKKEDKITKSK